jgi:hypothetical protein
LDDRLESDLGEEADAFDADPLRAAAAVAAAEVAEPRLGGVLTAMADDAVVDTEAERLGGGDASAMTPAISSMHFCAALIN